MNTNRRKHKVNLLAAAAIVALTALVALPTFAYADTADLTAGQATAKASLSIQAKLKGKGWQAAVGEGETAGATGKRGLCKLRIAVADANGTAGSICYQVFVPGKKWQKAAQEGKATGLAKKPASAVRIWLTDGLAQEYDVYYRVFIKEFGWLGWAQNKQAAGTTKLSEPIGALQVKLVRKGEAFDGSTAGHLVKSRWQALEAKYLDDENVQQLLEVKYVGGTKAKVVLRKKSGSKWKTALSCRGYVGKQGIGKAREGVSRTPSGDYEITSAFGIKDDPGSELPYVKVTEDMYWCGDRTCYNQLIDITEHPHDCAGEHLIDYSPHYNYGLFYDYNTHPIKYGAGSAMFIHCSGGLTSTAGCISVSQSNMVKIIRKLTPGARVCTYPK